MTTYYYVDGYSNWRDNDKGLPVLTVASIAEDGGYDWEAHAVLTNVEGKIYYTMDRGCSCNSFFEYSEVGDDQLREIKDTADWQALHDELAAEKSYYFSFADLQDKILKPISELLRARDVPPA